MLVKALSPSQKDPSWVQAFSLSIVLGHYELRGVGLGVSVSINCKQLAEPPHPSISIAIHYRVRT